VRAEVELPAGFSGRETLSVSSTAFGNSSPPMRAGRSHLPDLKFSTSLGREETASYNGFRKAIGSDRDQVPHPRCRVNAPCHTPAALHARVSRRSKKDYGKAVELLQATEDEDQEATSTSVGR
jgi:hypothetical protein